MIKKEYPKAVVLKKSLIGVVIVGLAVLVFLILYNLHRSSSNQNEKQAATVSSVQTLASTADTSWYQNQSIKKPLGTAQAFPVSGKPDSFTSQDAAMTGQNQEEMQKAMSASITSNQLNGASQHDGNLSGNFGVGPSGSSDNSASGDQNMQGEKKSFMQNSSDPDEDYLGSAVKSPVSPYELQAGTIIPGILITGINSDLPGQITGQVRSNVYDSISGKYLLVPQGAKLTGVYDSQVAYGQNRVLIAWKRIIFPNGKSIDLDGMPGADMSGYSGFKDKVNNHYTKIFGSVVLMSILSAGAQLSQPQTSTNPWQTPSVGQTMAQSLGTNISNTGTMITAKNINIQPTLEIRQGYEFNISVTKDMVFPGSYAN